MDKIIKGGLRRLARRSLLTKIMEFKMLTFVLADDNITLAPGECGD